MCDRITQAQIYVQNYAEHICNAIGVLQQNAQMGHLEDLNNDNSKRLCNDNQLERMESQVDSTSVTELSSEGICTGDRSVRNEESVAFNFGRIIAKMAVDIDSILDTLVDPSKDNLNNHQHNEMFERMKTNEQHLEASTIYLKRLLSACKDLQSQVRTRLNLITDQMLRIEQNTLDQSYFDNISYTLNNSSSLSSTLSTIADRSNKEDSSLTFGEGLELSDNM